MPDKPRSFRLSGPVPRRRRRFAESGVGRWVLAGVVVGVFLGLVFGAWPGSGPGERWDSVRVGLVSGAIWLVGVGAVLGLSRVVRRRRDRYRSADDADTGRDGRERSG